MSWQLTIVPIVLMQLMFLKFILLINKNIIRVGFSNTSMIQLDQFDPFCQLF